MSRDRPKGRPRRPGPSRQPCERVLVVCEGAKTEKFYLNGLLNHYQLSTADIRVLGVGADPQSLVTEAKRLSREEVWRGEKFDRIYCVFDRNSYVNFASASQDAEQSGICLARSWPCFEFWLLLHFCYTRKPYAAENGRSAGQNCVRDLQGYLPEYSKGLVGVFPQLLSRLDEAKSNAGKARKDARAVGEENPSTEFHELIEYLQSLAAG